jgi:hypothetical protein
MPAGRGEVRLLFFSTRQIIDKIHNKMRVKKKRQKYGLRTGSTKNAFVGLKPGDIRTFPFDECNWNSYRTRAGELNREAGYTKYSVSVDRLTNTLRIIHNV